MDGNGSSNSLNDQLNGVDIKPNAATIIKQDVMLSGSNNQSQSPVTSNHSNNISSSGNNNINNNHTNNNNNNSTMASHHNNNLNIINNNNNDQTTHILQNQQHTLTVENIFSALQQQQLQHQQQQQNNNNNNLLNNEIQKHTDLNNQTNLLAGLQTLAPTLLTNQQQQQQQQQTNHITQQLLLANQAALGLTSPNATNSTLPLQHLIIPVSAGNLNQQLLSIPISLAAAANLGSQMQLLTASNGQLIAANMPSQPLTFALPQANNGTQLQPVLMVGSQLGVLMSQLTQNANQNIQNLAFRQLIAQQQQQQNQTLTNTNSNNTNQAAAAAALINPAANLTQLITNAQGQIVAIGNPQLLQQTLAAVIANNNHATTTNSNNNNITSNNIKTTQQINKIESKLLLSPISNTTTTSATSMTSTSMTSTNQVPMSTKILNSLLSLTPSSSDTNNSTINSSSSDLNVASPSKFISQVAQALLFSSPTALAAAPNQQQQQQLSISSPISIFPVTSSTNSPPTSSLASPGITPNINQLLPNTISSSRDSGTIVDGVNLDEMREFAKQFKLRRLSLGLTQTQVGQALSITEGPSYSQSAICRFEKLDITPKSAQKIKPVLERWMSLAEERMKNGGQSLPDYIGLETSKKRKRRTSFTPAAIDILNECFDQNSHPTGSEMSELADKLNFDREVIRVWFCNKRQTLKNTIKKIKVPSSPES